MEQYVARKQYRLKLFVDTVVTGETKTVEETIETIDRFSSEERKSYYDRVKLIILIVDDLKASQ